jgi:hypothetical protein
MQASGDRPGAETALQEAARTGDWLDVDGDLAGELLFELLTERATAEPPRAVRLRSAHITGQLDLYATTLVCPLSLVDCTFERPVRFEDASASAISLKACHLPAVHGSGLETHGHLDLSQCHVDQVQLVGARIGGQLRMHGMQIAGGEIAGERIAVVADGLTAAELLARKEFVAGGEVRMVGARVERSMGFDGAKLHNPNGRALNLERMRVGGSLHCRNGFHAEGEVHLASASIAGQVSFKGAVLAAPAGRALFAERLQAATDVHCSDGFRATGTVSFRGARVGGQLNFAGAALATGDAAPHDGQALDLETAEIGTLFLTCEKAPRGTLNLRFARIGVLFDRPYSTPDDWPRCELDGCTYERLLTNKPVPVRHRLRWLPRGQQYAPQPYDQLAAAYRRAGLDADARIVGRAKERQRARTLPFALQAWSRFLDVTVAHGYRLWQAGIWLVALLGIGSALFYALDVGASPGANADVTPTKPIEQAPPFQPVLFTADLLVPVISLGQDAAWTARSTFAQWSAFALTITGWLLTAAFVAGLAIRRQ